MVFKNNLYPNNLFESYKSHYFDSEETKEPEKLARLKKHWDSRIISKGFLNSKIYREWIRSVFESMSYNFDDFNQEGVYLFERIREKNYDVILASTTSYNSKMCFDHLKSSLMSYGISIGNVTYIVFTNGREIKLVDLKNSGSISFDLYEGLLREYDLKRRIDNFRFFSAIFSKESLVEMSFFNFLEHNKTDYTEERRLKLLKNVSRAFWKINSDLEENVDKQDILIFVSTLIFIIRIEQTYLHQEGRDNKSDSYYENYSLSRVDLGEDDLDEVIKGRIKRSLEHVEKELKLGEDDNLELYPSLISSKIYSLLEKISGEVMRSSWKDITTFHSDLLGKDVEFKFNEMNIDYLIFSFSQIESIHSSNCFLDSYKIQRKYKEHNENLESKSEKIRNQILKESENVSNNFNEKLFLLDISDESMFLGRLLEKLYTGIQEYDKADLPDLNSIKNNIYGIYSSDLKLFLAKFALWDFLSKNEELKYIYLSPRLKRADFFDFGSFDQPQKDLDSIDEAIIQDMLGGKALRRNKMISISDNSLYNIKLKLNKYKSIKNNEKFNELRRYIINDDSPGQTKPDNFQNIDNEAESRKSFYNNQFNCFNCLLEFPELFENRNSLIFLIINDGFGDIYNSDKVLLKEFFYENAKGRIKTNYVDM